MKQEYSVKATGFGHIVVENVEARSCAEAIRKMRRKLNITVEAKPVRA